MEVLPSGCAKALSDAARETQAYVYKVAIADEAALLDKIKAAGVAVNQTDSAAFVKASASIYKNFAAAVPGSGDLIAKAQSLR